MTAEIHYIAIYFKESFQKCNTLCDITAVLLRVPEKKPKAMTFPKILLLLVQKCLFFLIFVHLKIDFFTKQIYFLHHLFYAENETPMSRFVLADLSIRVQSTSNNNYNKQICAD